MRYLAYILAFACLAVPVQADELTIIPPLTIEGFANQLKATPVSPADAARLTSVVTQLNAHASSSTFAFARVREIWPGDLKVTVTTVGGELGPRSLAPPILMHRN